MQRLPGFRLLLSAAVAASTLIAPALAEVPYLQEQVTAGTLPPMEERLPETPVVITPLESVGTYGGDFNFALKRGDVTHILRLVGYEGLFSWDVDWKEMKPNLARVTRSTTRRPSTRSICAKA